MSTHPSGMFWKLSQRIFPGAFGGSGLAKYTLKQEGLNLAFSWMCGSEGKFVEERRMLHTLGC